MVKTYLVCKKVEGLSEGTLHNYGHSLQNFFLQIQKSPEQVQPNDIRVYLYRYQETKGTSNRSLDKIRQIICGFFNWANCEGYIERNPAITIKPIKFEKKERQPMTQIELVKKKGDCKETRNFYKGINKKYIDKGVTSKDCDLYIEWIKNTYIPAINNKIKELKNK